MVESGYDRSLNSSLKRFPENTRIFLYEALKNSPLPLLIFDDKMKIISFDKQFSKFIQKNYQGLQYDNIKSLFPESFSLLKKAVNQLAFQDRAEIRNFSFKDKNNKEFIGSAMVVAHTKKDLRLYFLYLSGFEVRKPSNLLKNTAEFDEFIYHLTNTGKWLLDVENGDFIGSTICYEILGLKGPDKTIKFKEILNLISSREEKENLEKDIWKIVDDPQKTEREFRIKAQDSADTNTRYIRLVFNSINHEKKYVGGIMEDATEYKKAEKNLRKSISRIEKTDRFKSIFLTNLSHEIRTPMNAILGYSELLNQAGIKQGDIGRYTSIIKNKGNYLLSLIDDVIEISRFESGKIKFNYKEFLLLPLLKELYEEYESLKKQKGKEHIDIVLDVPEDAGEQLIYTDYGRLQQVLSNLLSNALKFTERGKIVFGYKFSSKIFKFFVRDTGVGLSEENRLQIFHRFETVEDTPLSRLSGTGLSLTIARHIVEGLGGKIKVKSELKEGSKFQLNIPATKPPVEKEKSREELNKTVIYNWKNKILLIAEDEEVNFSFLETVLQKTEARILHAKNGLEAVELCKKINQIDLVLMDIKMPLVNGYDATIEIKRYRADLPVIAQTAFASSEEINKCLEAGCDDFITKPININELLEKVNKQFTS